MPRRTIQEFRRERAAAMERLLDTEHLGIKRFLSLDSQCYRDDSAQGRLDDRTKELLGLVASTVLRCDDCIDYHLERCVALGWTLEEIEDALHVAMVVGGSITIPHIRRGKQSLDELFEEKGAGKKPAAAGRSRSKTTRSAR